MTGTMIDCPSPNFDERSLPVSIVVLHYTGMDDAASAIERLTNAEAKVSAHYLIAEDGQIVRMVDEDKRAWHAGQSFWRGITDINSASIGIEIVNPGHELGYRPFTQAQMDALVSLMRGIRDRHGIQPVNVVGHSDIAPTRKIDPGELFDWKLLAHQGLALARPKAFADPHWTDEGTLLALQRFGYDVSDGPATVRAFQRRFRPERIDGIIDEDIRKILLALLLEQEQTAAT